MTGEEHGGFLGAAYGANNTGDVAAVYDAWASSYDSEMANSGYRHPSICLALLARHLPRGSTPVLDAGAGTGLLGDWLAIMGYPQSEALDVSEGMLAVARRKAQYSAYHLMALGGALPFADGYFAGIVSAGVFTTGHVGAEALDELVRICAAGGVIVLTVKCALWDDGFSASLAQERRVSIVETTEPYLSMPGDAATTPSLGVVLRVL